MWSEKRGIEGTIVFAIFPIVWCILGNISYYLSGIERFYNFTSVINIENSTMMAILPLIVVVIAAIVNLKIYVDEEKLFEVNKSMFKYKIVNILFINPFIPKYSTPMLSIITLLDTNPNNIIIN